MLVAFLETVYKGRAFIKGRSSSNAHISTTEITHRNSADIDTAESKSINILDDDIEKEERLLPSENDVSAHR